MKTELSNLPREFEHKGFRVKDYGKIFLEEGEMVSFVTRSGKECDFTAHEWGFYLAPSLNSRFKREGFKVALVLNDSKQLYLNAVEEDKVDVFNKYLSAQRSVLLCWLDEWLDRQERIEKDT